MNVNKNDNMNIRENNKSNNENYEYKSDNELECNKNIIWDKCCECYIKGRNRFNEAFDELEIIALTSNDIICMGYYAILLARCEQNYNEVKYNQILELISNKMNELLKTVDLNDYVLSLKNKHEQYIFGSFYEIGIVVPKDYNLAYKLCQLSASQDFILAENSMCYYHDNGYGCFQSERLSFEYCLKSARKGYSLAQANLGSYYTRGKGTEKNEEEAIKWYQSAIDQGYLLAQYFLGLFYVSSSDTSKHDKGFELIMNSAERGCSKSQYYIGIKYYFGCEKFLVNEQESIKWLLLAANQGEKDAESLLGFLYHYGRVVQKDRVESIKWFNKACKRTDFPKAKLPLAIEYINDTMNPVNQKLGFEYLTQLYSYSKTRFRECIYGLGLCYEYGLGVEQNELQAFRYYSTSRFMSYPPGSYAVGRCYEEGINININIEESQKVYKIAAEQGSIDANMRINEFDEDKRRIRMNEKTKKYEFI